MATSFTTGRSIKDAFLTCLTNCRTKTQPYDHWLLSDALPEEVADGIAGLPFPPATIERYLGQRNAEDDKRVYLNPETNSAFAVCRELSEVLDSTEARAALESLCGIELTGGHLRIEYCQDTDGFWLEPHTDIGVKKFTMLIYLSRDPQLHDAGTDVYDSDLNLVDTAPYAFNEGLIFIPGDNTWHGFRKRPIRGIRKALIVNYVTSEWRDTWELVRGRVA